MIGFFVLFVIVINLACNLPLPFINAWFGNQRKDDAEDIKRDIVDTFEATLVSAEGDIVGITPPDGTSWSCVDVSGELSFFTDPDNLTEGQVVIKAELDLDLYYRGEDAWDHTKSKKEAIGHRMLLWENGAFAGIVLVTDTREISYPKPVSSKIEFQNNVFGLINPLDYKQAYFCDLSGIPIPENLKSLTVENFQEHCILYYYECTAK